MHRVYSRSLNSTLIIFAFYLRGGGVNTQNTPLVTILTLNISIFIPEIYPSVYLYYNRFSLCS